MPRILLRRMTAADWTATNPVLGDGEPAIEHDTKRMKVGDGVSAWSALEYTGGSGGGTITSNDITDATTIGKALIKAVDQPTALSTVGAATAAQGAKADTAVQPGSLATIATTGSADNLIDGTTNKAYTATEKTKLAAITGTNTGDETATTIKTKLGITTLSGSNTGDQTSVTGNAGTATKLATPVTIAGQSFDGSANITIPLSALTGLLGLAQLPVGSSFHVVSTDGGTTWKDLAGTTLAARPTSRTDVRGIFETSGSTLPAWAITGDLLFKIGT